MTDHPVDPLELAALIASRVCHDLLNPVAAMRNGLEVLEEEKDESMRAFAMDLVRKTATIASAKLEFARIAFGAAGSAGAEIDMVEAGRCAGAYLESEKPRLDWRVGPAMLPKAQAKLLLNLLILAANSVPRGGAVTVTAEQDGGESVMRLIAEGDRARFPAGARAVLTEGIVPDPLTAHVIQPYYAALLARDAGMSVTVSEEEGRVVIGARSAT
jgi:histidine phosphotransferase ChpT